MRKIVIEEFGICGCLPKHLKHIISDREAVIELLGHSMKRREVGCGQGVGVGSESNGTIAIN